MIQNKPPPELERLAAIAAAHTHCTRERPRIDAGAVLVPFDFKLADGGWRIQWERATNRRELLEILGF